MKQLQPKLRFYQYTDKWISNKISDRMDVFRGASPRPKGSPKYYGGSIPRLMIEDATRDGKYTIPKIDTLTQEGARKSRFLPKGSPVLSCSGTKVGIPTILSVDACIHDGWLGFKNFSDVDSEFLYYNFLKLYDKIQSSATTGGVFNNLTTGIIKDYIIFFPTLPEQTKIASFLSTVDEKITGLKKQLSLLESYKKGVMQKIFSQELRFKDENGNEFPDWEEKKIKEIMDERNSQAPKSVNYPLMAFIAKKGVTPKGDRYNREFLVNDQENKKYKKTEFGDFIYSSNNLETGSIGFNKYGSATISPVYSIFKINELADFRFLSDYLSRKEFIYKMTTYRQGVVYGQWRIHESDFLQIKEYMPSVSEQKKIASFLSAIDEKIDKNEDQIRKMELWKKGLLQQMFV
jgi:type I restriction enzyme S subunit